MDIRLDNYDWAEVFGEGTGGNCTTLRPQVQPPGTKGVKDASFGREDVAEITMMLDGEREVESWIIYGQLKDERYFIARGSCDYTGWDCVASNSADVAKTLPKLISFGMTPDERTRFGLPSQT